MSKKVLNLRAMETLLKSYKRRLKTAMKEITKGGNDITITRLGTKASCYRTIIGELERAMDLKTEMLKIDTMIEKWEEEFAFCEQQEINNLKNKEYITAHNHAVRKEQIRLFINDLNQL